MTLRGLLARLWAYRPLGKALLIFLAAGLFMMICVSVDYADARGEPRESVVLVEVRPSGHRTSCGRELWDGSDEYVYVYRAASAPPSSPSSFELLGCPGEGRVGDVVTVACAGTCGQGDVHIGPPDSVVEVFALSGLVALPLALLGLLWFAVADVLARRARPGRHLAAP